MYRGLLRVLLIEINLYFIGLNRQLRLLNLLLWLLLLLKSLLGAVYWLIFLCVWISLRSSSHLMSYRLSASYFVILT